MKTKTEFEKVKYRHYSELTELFNDDNLFHAKCGMFLKVDEFDVLVELVEDGDEVYKRNKNSGTKMKTEIKYEKLEYNFWNLSELEEYFQNGELYHKAGGQFYQFKNLAELSTSTAINGVIYKRVETPVTLEDELSKISFGEVSVCCFTGMIALCDEDFEMHVSEDFILRIAEAIKRHRK